MKILTLNTHSLVEEDYERKLLQFVEMAAAEQPDIIGLQEVNQRKDARVLPEERLHGYTRCSGFQGAVKEGNHAARLAELLEKKGVSYHWTWIPVKLGYDIYEEGLAVFSRRPILETDEFSISHTEDFHNWKRRKILGIRTDGPVDHWFYTVHMGWWKKDEETFWDQWDAVQAGLEDKIKGGGNVWIMGDFNSPAQAKNEGYDYVKQSGWLDTYTLAQKRSGEYTVEQVIDGWRDRNTCSGMRINYIWSRRREAVTSSRVVFDGTQYPQISDHYGVMIETEEEK